MTGLSAAGACPRRAGLRGFAGGLAFACLVVAGIAGAGAAEAPASDRLAISGDVKSALSLGVDELRAVAASQIETLTVVRGGGEGRPAAESAVRGVQLARLLERAGLAAAGHNDWKHTVVLVTATDGYQVVFSWPELFDTAVGAGVLVVFERDGQPLADREGRIALVSARDTHPGPRSVRSVATVEVRVLK